MHTHMPYTHIPSGRVVTKGYGCVSTSTGGTHPHIELGSKLGERTFAQLCVLMNLRFINTRLRGYRVSECHAKLRFAWLNLGERVLRHQCKAAITME